MITTETYAIHPEAAAPGQATSTVRALTPEEMRQAGGGDVVVTRMLDKSSLAALLLPAVQRLAEAAGRR